MVEVADLDYELPAALVAQQPLSQRDQSRLMVLDRAAGKTSQHVFGELPELLGAGDLLVLNDTAVIPARFDCRRATGGKVEGLFLRELADGDWEVMLARAGRCKPGDQVELAGGQRERLVLRENLGRGVWHVRPKPPAPALEILGRVGRTPLPPYIRRTCPCADTQDRQAYQTVYAARPGAVAAPTAGLHFTQTVLDRLTARGIETALVTLHVGLGTFAPVKVDRPERHRMHAEWYELSPAAASAVERARSRGRRIVAVGTTSLRVLESAAARGRLESCSGWTDIFIYPPYDFRVVGALLTNFHLPRSTLLMLAAAFCAPGKTDGVATILSAYRQAIDLRYRFYSYGDAMLIQ